MNKKDNVIKIFNNKKIRVIWDEKEEKYYWSIVDICKILTEQPDIRGATLYWSKLKQRLNEEGSKLLTNCQQLKMKANDGKSYKTVVTSKNAKILFKKEIQIRSLPEESIKENGDINA